MNIYTHVLIMKWAVQYKLLRITSGERVYIYLPGCTCMQGKGQGKELSLLCCKILFLSVVMTVVLGQ